MLSNNHTLPMFGELQFEDIVFCMFPKAGAILSEAYDFWAKNSVGDLIEMIMQMLEGLAFIHDLGIAHRDAFTSNFVIQWQPESMLEMKISPSRPRVYLIDFEVAIEFPPECPAEERLGTGYPSGGSFGDLSEYAAPRAPECASGKPYSPFKLDVWQLGTSLSNFKTKVGPIDAVLEAMTATDQADRPSAQEALDQIGKVYYSMPPQSLLFLAVKRPPR